MKHIGNKRGESMIVAVLMMLVFFSLGGAMLTAASLNAVTVQRRVEGKQHGAVVDSAVKTILYGMQEGRLHEGFSAYFMENKLLSLLKNHNNKKEDEAIDIPIEADPINISMKFPDSHGLGSCAIENFYLDFGQGIGSCKYFGAGKGKEKYETEIYDIHFPDVQLSFDVVQGDKRTRVSFSWDYSGSATVVFSRPGGGKVTTEDRVEAWNAKWTLTNQSTVEVS